MKHNIYQNAVDHLEFSDNLYDTVVKKEQKPRSCHRIIRFVAAAAVMITLMVFGTFAADLDFKKVTVGLKEIGSVEADMLSAQLMEFQKLESTNDVSIHYLEMDMPGGYSFKNGYIYHQKGGIYRIDSEYQLVPVEGQIISGQLNKNGDIHRVEYQYVSVNTEIIALNAPQNIMDDGRILAVVWTEDQHCWPVYLNLEDETVTDALPCFSDDDFTGRICYAEPFRDGILLTTVYSSDVFVDGVINSHNLLYYIKNGSSKAIEITPPRGNNSSFYCENDTIYWKAGSRPLYQLDDNYEFRQIDEFRTTDDLTKGLLTGRSSDGHLMVCDYYNNVQYHFDDISPDRWDFYETTGYNATRHSEDGKILITYSYDDYEAKTRRISRIGLLDPASGTLKMLDTHSNFKMHTFGWLDDDRFAVIYEKGARKFMCIYEFLG